MSGLYYQAVNDKEIEITEYWMRSTEEAGKVEWGERHYGEDWDITQHQEQAKQQAGKKGAGKKGKESLTKKGKESLTKEGQRIPHQRRAKNPSPKMPKEGTPVAGKYAPIECRPLFDLVNP